MGTNTVPPIQKKCKVCKTKKLLNEFDFNERAKDKHETICKSCREPSYTCDSCIDHEIVDAAYPIINLLLTLVKDGVQLPSDLLDQITGLAHLGGMKCYCDSGGKKI